MRPLLAVMTLCTMLAGLPAAAADAYPSRPIRLIVPFAAGGASDTAARTLSTALRPLLGQQIVVDNRPGANGAIAAQAALGAPADGHTLLWGVASMAALPLMHKRSPFQSLEEFVPVSLVGRFAFCIVVHPGLAATTVADLAALARANPGAISYASSTLAEDKSATLFMKAAGVTMLRVPYKGGAQVMPDLMAGRVQVHFGTLSSALTHAREGRLRLLAVLLPQRSAAAPDVPTLAEAGMPGFSVPTWQAVLAPPGTPASIVDRLAREISVATQGAAAQALFSQQGLQLEGSTPQTLAALIKADTMSWRQFVRDQGIQPE